MSRVRERPPKTNLQHAMHNFYWYIIEFYFYFRPVFDRAEHKMFREKYIRCRYRDCVYRALHWNISYFFLFVFCLCFTILFLSTVGFCVVPTESGRQQHRVYRENIFCVDLNVLWKIYIKASVYWNSTNETNSDGRAGKLLHSQHRFLFSWQNRVSFEHTTSGSMEKSNYSFFITVVFFLYFETYKNNIKHWFDSKSDCYCWIQKILEPKWWKLRWSQHSLDACNSVLSFEFLKPYFLIHQRFQLR